MDPYKSALSILPLAFDLILDDENCPRVIDVGCGDMGWLRAAVKLGAGSEAILGIDMWPVEEAEEKVPVETRSELVGRGPKTFNLPYTQMDLRTPKLPQEDSRWRECDLVICVEVAEHLPESSADSLVAFVTSLTQKAILWSAALPGQGPYPPFATPEQDAGAWHVNEQPGSYWKHLFKKYGFRQRGFLEQDIKHAVRQGAEVDPWYLDGIALYVKTQSQRNA